MYRLLTQICNRLLTAFDSFLARRHVGEPCFKKPSATLDRVVFSFRVPELRKAAPATMPRFRVFRRDALGNVDELQATKAGDGFVSPPNPGSAYAWFSDGFAQTFEYVCD